MASAAALPNDNTTLAKLAREYLTTHDGDTPSAINALVRDLLADTALLRSVVRSAISDSVSYRVEHSMRAERALILQVTGKTREGVIHLANGLSRALLDMPL